MRAGRLIVRPATAGDMRQVHAVSQRSGLRSARRPAVLDFYRTSPGGRLVVGCRNGRVISVACAVSFGRTGWLGNVAVDPGWRGRGIGAAISAAALDWLRQAQVTTVLLTATDLGRPVYERLGFTDEGVSYGIWELEPRPFPAADSGAGVGPGQIGNVIRQDAEATGEDRHILLAPFAARIRAPGGDRAGFGVRLPWGGGPVVAPSAESARALLIDMIQADPNPWLAFPEANSEGADLASSLGFRRIRRVARMRLGPPIQGFRPKRIFNVFSLAVG